MEEKKNYLKPEIRLSEFGAQCLLSASRETTADWFEDEWWEK